MTIDVVRAPLRPGLARAPLRTRMRLEHVVMGGAILALIVLVVLPLLSLLFGSVKGEHGLSLDHFEEVLSGRLYVNALKNSLIPVVTTLGPTFAFLVTGSVIVETVFSIPGIGRAFVVAIESRDYPMILGTTVLFSLVIAVANLVVDVAYVFIDPRVRLT